MQDKIVSMQGEIETNIEMNIETNIPAGWGTPISTTCGGRQGGRWVTDRG